VEFAYMRRTYHSCSGLHKKEMQKQEKNLTCSFSS
jgi:hypothetical protein